MVQTNAFVCGPCHQNISNHFRGNAKGAGRSQSIERVIGRIFLEVIHEDDEVTQDGRERHDGWLTACRMWP
jgi:hypothetical protein